MTLPEVRGNCRVVARRLQRDRQWEALGKSVSRNDTRDPRAGRSTDCRGIDNETAWQPMKHATSRELYEYWNRVRGDDAAPQRSDIEPSDLRRVLADTFILEVSGREQYLVRLAGTRVCAIYCREIKGMNLLDLWQSEDRSAVATLAAAVSEDGAAAVVTLSAINERSHAVACELLLLPLRHGGAGFDRILGSLAALERPYWLGTQEVVSQSITSLRLIWPDEAPQFMRRRRSDLALAERSVPPTPIRFPLHNSRRRGHLFVLEGGKK